MLAYRNIIEDLVVERLLKNESEDIPVIITGKDCNCDDLEKYVIEAGGKIKHKLPIIDAVAAYMPSVGVRNITRGRVVNKILLDDRAYKLMNVATVTVGSDYANEHGLTGKNIGVAVIDTGVSPHSDLTRPVNRIIAFKDFVGDKSSPYDDDGHGTHVAGIIAGNGFSSRGKYMGVAPDANIIAIKALDAEGSGSISDVVAGIQWAIENKERYNIKVATLSLGTKAKSSCQEDPLCRAVDAAIRSGITVVTAAGNSGPEPSTINSPGINPRAITVGAFNDRSASNNDDIKVPDFSSRGPTPEGYTKPDILAPGVDIKSLAHDKNGYVELTGTSMAAPIVAGCAALLYENNDKLSPSQIKALITENAANLGLDQQIQGAGLLDIKNTINVINPTPSPQPPARSPHHQNGGKTNDLISVLGNWIFVILIVLILLIL